MRTIIGLFVVLIIILGVWGLYRTSPEFRARLAREDAQEQEAEDSNQTDGNESESEQADGQTTDGMLSADGSLLSVDSSTQNGQTKGDQTTNSPAYVMPETGSGDGSSLMTCSPEILNQNCTNAEAQPVCSVDTTTFETGQTTTQNIEYISACHYCSLFGSQGEISVGDTTISSSGYTTGTCN